MEDLDALLMRMKEDSTRSIMGRTVKRLGPDMFFVDGAPTTRTNAVAALQNFTHADFKRGGASKTMAFRPEDVRRSGASYGNAKKPGSGHSDRAREPKFKLGDKVRVKGTGVVGKVSYIGSYDSTLKQYRIKVLEDRTGSRQTWNEDSLARVK